MSKNEITLNKENKFITKYGSLLEDNHPSVLYLRTKSKITPKVNQKDYINEVNSVKKQFSEFVKNTILKSKIVNNDYLFNIDISSKSMKYGKVSFLRYDVYLKPVELKTIEGNRFRMQELSINFDKKLESLLNSNNIICR